MGAGPQLWHPGTSTVVVCVTIGTTVTTAGFVWVMCGQDDLVQTAGGMVKVPVISGQVAVVVGTAVLPGHHVVYVVRVSVVT